MNLHCLWGQPGGCPRSSLLHIAVFLWALTALAACNQASFAPIEAGEQPPATATATLTATPVPTLPPPPITVDYTPVPSPTKTASRIFESPEYGVHISQWWHLDALERDLALTNEMGFGWVKQKFPWRDIEKAQDQFDWFRPDEIVATVERAGLKLIVRLDSHPLWSVESLPDELITANQPPVDYQDFGDFCHALAQRYRGRIAAYQVWNEPNLSREWGEQPPDPAAYTELLRVCYEGIKTADPQATVISAGLAPTGTEPPLAMPDDDFLQGMYDAGAAAYFDALGVNAPGYKAPPETSPAEGETVAKYGGHRWNVFRHVEEIRDIMVRNNDAGKQVVILEMGWILHQELHPSYTWHGVSEQEQADYLVRAYRYARENWQPWIGLMTTIYLPDFDWIPGENEQYWWAITLPDGTPRPAFYALRDMEK